MRLWERKKDIIFLATVSIGLTLAHTSVGQSSQSRREKTLEGALTYGDYSPALIQGPESESPPAPFDQGVCILIELEKQRAWLYKDSKRMAFSSITSGKRGKETPTGDFFVINKHEDWISTIYNRSMPYFLRLNPGDFGIHQGVITKTPSSNGCIRLPEVVAQQFFDLCPIGTRVRIVK